jgi:hypothetical protein
MGKVVEIAPGLTDVWKLWRHCLCRFGWYPIFVAPLITCAAFMDLYSSSGCDFIRLDIGFVPVNEVWEGDTAYLGLFSYDTFEVNSNKWKRSFNNGCEAYSTNFVSMFIGADQTWQITRIMAYISGCASLVAVAMAWLLTITPLPASFFWPGVLLPASILSMLTGCAKFLFFDTQICTEELWFAEGADEPVAPQSCNMGDSAVYAVASVAAYFLCTILICVRSPHKRDLDPNYGIVSGPTTEVTVDSEETRAAGNADVELGTATNSETAVANMDISKDSTSEKVVQSPAPPPAQIIDISQPKGHNHVRTSSDVTTWTAASNQLALGFGDVSRIRVLSPTPDSKAKAKVDSNVVWDTSFGVFMAVDDDRDLFDGKTQRRSNVRKTDSPDNDSTVWKSPDRLPPRSSSIRTGRSIRQIRETDSGSVCSKISKVSFAETHFSEESFFYEKGSVSSANNSAPSVVSIPKRIVSSSQKTLKYSSGSPGKSRVRREDRNDAYSDHSRLDSRRERFEHLPRLNELASPKSNDDHGELINACLRDLHQSFATKEFGTM